MYARIAGAGAAAAGCMGMCKTGGASGGNEKIKTAEGKKRGGKKKEKKS